MTANLRCPQCNGTTFTDYGDGLVACQRCYTQYDLNQQQCPHCGSLLAQGAAICTQCGADLQGDLAERTIRESLMTRDDRLRMHRTQVQQTRTKEKAASRQRLDAWWEQDRRQREAARQERIARQRRERRFLVLALITILAIALFLALASVVFLSSTEPDPTPATWLISVVS